MNTRIDVAILHLSILQLHFASIITQVYVNWIPLKSN